LQVGYVGSLEPGASGLMVLLMGKATALARLVRATPTRYTGLVRLGTSTDTYDSRGKVTSQAPTSHITDAAIAESLAHDIGLALGCGAHLAQLRRESVGGFSVDDAWTLDAFMPAARKFAKNK
ncbi:tRNA pseudouridine synthase B, partial [Haematococcus lacustris]